MKLESFANVWDAIESDPAEAARMAAISRLLIAVQEVVKAWNLSPGETAKRLSVSVKRVHDIRKGRINELDLDELLTLATRAGLHVSFDVQRPAA